MIPFKDIRGYLRLVLFLVRCAPREIGDNLQIVEADMIILV
jgi:hypothetical protein